MKHTWPGIKLISQFDIVIVFDHLVGRDHNTMLWLVVFNL